MKTKQKSSKRGFTLTEILVVVMIVAVLAAVVYPLYTKAVTKSRAVEAINLLEMVRNKQIQKYARDNNYFNDFTTMGQLTNNLGGEQALSGGAQMKINDYTLSLNNATNCMSARYRKGSNDFTFSTSYESAGLGCTGAICTSFGNIIGGADSVCNCGAKKCGGDFTLNPDTCNCDCNKACNDGNSCRDMTGGGLTRVCSTGCGEELSVASCNGSIWSGKCWSATQEQPTSQNCGFANSGTQTRKCSATCGKGSCDPWGQCIGQICDKNTKPAGTQPCGKCGTQTQSVDCDDKSSTWIAGGFGTCTGQGVCEAGTTQKCGNKDTGTQTCSDSCGWGACTGEEFECAGESTQACGNCGTQTRTCDKSTGKWNEWNECSSQGECAVGATEEGAACSDGLLGILSRTCSETCAWGEWAGCTEPACVSPKVWDKDAAACVCGNVCTSTACPVGETCATPLPNLPDPETCECGPQTSTAVAMCSSNQILDLATEKCVCNPAVCKNGYNQDSSTCECYPPPCTANKHWDDYRGECVCGPVSSGGTTSTLPKNKTYDSNCNLVCLRSDCSSGYVFMDSDCKCHKKYNGWIQNDSQNLTVKMIHTCNYGLSGGYYSTGASIYGGVGSWRITGLENIASIYKSYKNCPTDLYMSGQYCQTGEYCRYENNPCASSGGQTDLTTTTGGGNGNSLELACGFTATCDYSVSGGSFGLSSMMPCGGGDPGCSPGDKYYYTTHETNKNASVSLMRCESSVSDYEGYYPGETPPATTTTGPSGGGVTTTTPSTSWP